MEEIQYLHHMVHIWFDEWEHLEFTEAIKKRIRLISDKAWHILNFVDEPLYSQLEAENVQVIKLAEVISDFIAFQHLKSTPLWKHIGDEIKWRQPEVINYLMQLLDWQWQKLREPSKLEEDFLKSIHDLRSMWPLPENILNDISQKESLYKNILSEQFLDILLQSANHFNGKNIFGIKTSENLCYTKSKNQERKDEIIEIATSLLWYDRIIVSWMNDWDLNKIITSESDIVEEMNQRKDDLSKLGITYEIWEQEHWNAQEYVWNINNEITKMRFERYKNDFFSTLKSKWFEISPDITRHILWWEYYNRCVNNYWRILHKYGVSFDKMGIDPTISLVHPED